MKVETGGTCGLFGLEFTRNGKVDEPTDFDDYPGFPLVQQTIFNGKKFCGKKIKSMHSEQEWVSPQAERRFKECPSGSVSCGDGLCVADAKNCPVTSLQLLPKDSTVTDDQESLEFDAENILVYSRDKTKLPLTQIRLELSRPCFNAGF